ncbi:D-2-hydroxyacid dehydrogenase [Thermoflavifilum thermophilum]|uniref:Glycerate dehydrogenase n=1 Tax=Thermoflavifilum thermophilum TaxID=1393122 RepID=A0A1I7ND02_9BACT|nr:D-2-hydroxyacid dehydrogenase [Thermoflavifilum thermophilum]SFV32436.1 glycerate dehydrogenase [Thermoflavifilum thermophilum]
MRIALLDGYTLNPGDLSREPLLKLGEVHIYDRTTPDQLWDRVAHADAILTNKVVIPSDVIQQAPSLQYIGVMATGYNVVDVAAARKKGIVVTHVPDYSTFSVAQHTFALLLELTQHVGLHNQSVHAGDWTACADFSYQLTPLIELHRLTLGIVGLGRIGRAVARIGLAMGMRVLAVHTHPERDLMDGVEFVDVQTCFRQADVVTLHCPLTASNAGFVNKALLSLMKPGAFLINTARGGLIEENDLAEALNSGLIAGAGLDVLSVEPPPADHPLLHARNCIITPHQAWATRAARQRLMNQVVENLKAFQAGKPIHVVN